MVRFHPAPPDIIRIRICYNLSMSFMTINIESIYKNCVVWFILLVISWLTMFVFAIIGQGMNDGIESTFGVYGLLPFPISLALIGLGFFAPIFTAIYGGILAFSSTVNRRQRVFGVIAFAIACLSLLHLLNMFLFSWY